MKKIILMICIICAILITLCGCNPAADYSESIAESALSVTEETLNESDLTIDSHQAESEAADGDLEPSMPAATKEENQTESQSQDLPIVTEPEPQPEPIETAEPETPVHEYSEMELEIFNLMNAEREKVGLNPLNLSQAFYPCAEIRAKEADVLWSHTRPNGENYYNVIEEQQMLGRCTLCGENLGRNFTTAQIIVDALMNSEGHRANILNERFTAVAISVIPMTESPDLYVMSQIFVQEV